MTRGRFISFEGGEGVGKSTNVDIVEQVLTGRGLDVVRTREPGGTPLAEEIRAVVLAERAERVDPVAETLLIFAARAQHVAEVVAPALREGRWVLCERFTDSTYAYQAGGRGVDAEVVTRLAEMVHPGIWPDLTLYLDAPLEVAEARLAGRKLDRIESERRAFFQRARRTYLELAERETRVVRIDAGRELAAVQRQIVATVEQFLDCQ